MIPRCVAIDTETTGLNVYAGDRMFSAAAYFDDGRSMFWYEDWGGLRELLADESIDKVFHNAKFDMKMIEREGMKIRGKVWDTMIFAHLLDGRQPLNLDDVSIRYLPSDQRKVVEEIAQFFEEAGINKKREQGKHFRDLPVELLKKRNIGDAQLTMNIFKRVYETVAKVFPFLLAQEHRLLHVVKGMEDRGIAIDAPEIAVQSVNFEAMVQDVLTFCEGVVGWDDFSLDKPTHVEELLRKAGIYDAIQEFTDGALKLQKQGLVVPGKSDRRKCDDYNLRGLHHPVAHMVLVGKMANKMRSTFLDGMLERAVNGVIHASFNQLGTDTGRFSCSNPNLQNIPIEGNRRWGLTTEEDDEAFEMTGMRFAPHIKRIFLVRKGMAHIHSDKKQAELYMLGHYANDPKMTEMFMRTITNGTSIHDEVCMALFGEWTKGLKTRTKMVIFGYQYGAGPATLAKRMGSSLEEAVAMKAKLGKMLPALPRWQRQLSEQVAERGYVQTDHGRRHYLKDSENYMAVNRMCQGSVGDEVKNRMLALDDYFRSEGDGAQILLNIHDDICSEVPAKLAPKYAKEIYRIMHETSIPYRLPLPSSLDVSYTRWSDLKEIDAANSTYKKIEYKKEHE